MFSIAKIFFYYTECKKYNNNNNVNNNNNNNNKILAKRFEPATSWSPSLYSTAAPLTLRHYTPLGMIPLVCGGDRHFQYFFFGERSAR
jgi:hypothetical protein